MFGVAAGRQSTLPYNGWRALRHWCAMEAVRSVCLIALVLASAGCSYRIGSLMGHDETPEYTASLGASKPAASAGAQLADSDVAIAKAAALDAVSRGQDASLPWENPATGARGTVTPLANAYTQDGFTCRDFLASYVRGGAESWLQGEACRVHRGQWEVRQMRPWKRS